MVYASPLLTHLLPSFRLLLLQLETMKVDRKIGLRVSSGVQLTAKAAQAVV
jgi:hypothetical protein